MNAIYTVGYNLKNFDTSKLTENIREQYKNEDGKTIWKNVASSAAKEAAIQGYRGATTGALFGGVVTVETGGWGAVAGGVGGGVIGGAKGAITGAAKPGAIGVYNYFTGY